jgi:hypothetical protein
MTGSVTPVGLPDGLMDHGRDYDQPGEDHEGDHGPFRRHSGAALGVAILMPPTVTIAVPQTPAHDTLLAARQKHVLLDLGGQTGLTTIARQILMQVATRDIRQLTYIEDPAGMAAKFPPRTRRCGQRKPVALRASDCRFPTCGEGMLTVTATLRALIYPSRRISGSGAPFRTMTVVNIPSG